MELPQNETSTQGRLWQYVFTLTEPSPFIPQEKNPNPNALSLPPRPQKNLPVQKTQPIGAFSWGSHNARHARTKHTDHITTALISSTKYRKTLEPGKPAPNPWPPPRPAPPPPQTQDQKKKITSLADMRTNTQPCLRPAKLSWRWNPWYCRGEWGRPQHRAPGATKKLQGLRCKMISWLWPETGLWVLNGGVFYFGGIWGKESVQYQGNV